MQESPSRFRDPFGLDGAGVTFLATGEAWRLSPSLSGIAAQVLLFWIAFSTPLFVMVSPLAIQIPFFTACFFSIAALLLRPDAKEILFEGLRSPYALMASAFCVYVSLAVGRSEVPLEQSSSRFGAVGLVALFSLASLFPVICRSSLRGLNASPIFNAGIFLGLTSLIAITVYEYSIVSLFPPDRAAALSKDMTAINRSIEIFSILIFLIPILMPAQRFFFVSWGTLFVLSFFVLGVWSVTGRVQHVDCDTAQFAMPIALLVYLFARASPLIATKLIYGAIAGVVVCAPWFYTFIYQYCAPFVVFRSHVLLDRMEIWSGVSRSILSSDWFEFIFGAGRESLRKIGNFSIDGVSTTVMPFHPHNMLLQLWLDLGVVGVLFILAFFYKLYKITLTVPEQHHPAMLATLTMVFAAASVTRSLWHVWYLCVLLTPILLILIFASVDRQKAP